MIGQVYERKRCFAVCVALVTFRYYVLFLDQNRHVNINIFILIRIDIISLMIKPTASFCLSSFINRHAFKCTGILNKKVIFH